MANSPDFWSILRTLHPVSNLASTVFETLEDVATGSPAAVSADNYEAAIGLLNKFATAGSVGAVQEQRRDQAARKGKVGKENKEKQPQ